MPQRFLRPGIRTSERWNSVSRDAQALYIAMLTLVDDFGRYDGRPAVLHGDAFSIWNDLNPDHAVNSQRTAALCGELQKARLVHFYEVKGKKCLQMIQWEERIRDGAKEKWPKAEEIDIPQDSAGFRSVPLPPTSTSTSTSTSTPTSTPTPSSTPTPPVNSSFVGLRVANRIISNSDAWHYDNCKVRDTELKSKPLASLIEPHVGRLTEDKIVRAWQVAVTVAHGAHVDGLARDATKYCVQVFKEKLKEAK